MRMVPRGPILAFGAHPDDIELGCGATLAKLADEGAQIHAVVFSRGRRGQLSDADREAETRRALGKIGIASVTIHDLPDTRLWQHANELIALVEGHVTRIQPARVYTMFQHDRHQDHRAVFDACNVGCRSVPELLGYETPSSYPNFVPTVFETVDEHLECKVSALKCHESQGERLYMQEEKVRAAAHFRGVQVNIGPAEGFIPYKLVSA